MTLRRRSKILARCALLLVASVGGAASVAVAQGEERPVRVEYRVPPACPDEAAFFGEVHARTSRVRRAAEGERAHAITVDITRSGEKLSAHLVLRDPEGRVAERDVAGERCEEVVTAVALVAALAIDPMARTDASVVASAGSAPSAASSSSAPPPASSAPPPPPPPPPPAPRRDDGWEVGVSVGVLASLASSPVLMIGPTAFFEVVGPARGPVAPTFRVGAHASPTQSTSPADGGTASFTFYTGLLDVCPFGWRRGALSLEPCARFEAGVVNVVAADVVSPQSAARAWFAGDVLGHVAWKMGGPFVLEGEVGAVFPMVRDSFSFFPSRHIYDTTAVGLDFGLTLGMRWK